MIYISLTLIGRIFVLDLDSYWRIFAVCLPISLVVIMIYLLVISLVELQTFRLVYHMGKGAFKKVLAKVKQ